MQASKYFAKPVCLVEDPDNNRIFLVQAPNSVGAGYCHAIATIKYDALEDERHVRGRAFRSLSVYASNRYKFDPKDIQALPTSESKPKLFDSLAWLIGDRATHHELALTVETSKSNIRAVFKGEVADRLCACQAEKYELRRELRAEAIA